MALDKLIEGIIYGIVGLIVVLQLYATLVPEAQTAGDTLNASGVPFGSFFTGDGIVFTLVMVGLLLFVLRNALSSAKGKMGSY